MRKKLLPLIVIIFIAVLTYFYFSPVKFIRTGGRSILMYGRGIVTADGSGMRRIAVRYMKDITTDGDYLYYISGKGRGRYGDTLTVYDLDHGKTVKVLDIHDRKPWKIDCGDVDGDGHTDILVLVYKKTLFDPVMDNRPFVYSYDGYLYAKWLGSRLSHPILDAQLKDVDGDGVSELVSTERGKDGGKMTGVYKWDSFGFIEK